ncbi:MAG: 2-oxoglutarate dehydrogenase E1 subunit family protein, partial [Acidimicrobiales bacterium]
MPPDPAHSDSLGVNVWLVEEMYQVYRSNPLSVSDDWRDFFAGYRGRVPPGDPTVARPRAAGAGGEPVETTLAETRLPPVAPGGRVPDGDRPSSRDPGAAVPVADGDVTLLRGARGRIAENMIASLAVPTATSVHPIPAGVLAANRSLL